MQLYDLLKVNEAFESKMIDADGEVILKEVNAFDWIGYLKKIIDAAPTSIGVHMRMKKLYDCDDEAGNAEVISTSLSAG